MLSLKEGFEIGLTDHMCHGRAQEVIGCLFWQLWLFLLLLRLGVAITIDRSMYKTQSAAIYPIIFILSENNLSCLSYDLRSLASLCAETF